MIELDKRIIEGKKPLTCFDAEQARNFVTKNCYLTNDISLFSDLNAFKKVEWGNSPVYEGVVDTLTNINTEVTLIFETTYRRWKFCIPCEWVKEEKLAPKHIDFEAAKKDSNFELCEMYGNELLFDTKNNIFYTSDGNVHTYLTVLAQRHYNEEQPKDVIIEKKYRPLSYKDFWRLFDFGDGVCFRRKGQDTAEFSMLLGYEIDSDGNRAEIPGEGKVNLGGNRYTLAELFEYYEMKLDGEWQPFGVLEK